MSKAEGKKIGIKFNAWVEPLELNTSDVIDILYSIPAGVASAGYTYNSSYAPNKAFDGNTSTYWRGNGAPQWIMMELSEPKKIAGFRLYSGSSSRVNALNLFGSVDGTNFELIVATTNSNSTGWKEHTFDITKEYKYFRWETVSHYSYAAYIYELQLLFVTSKYESGNEQAFAVSGQEYMYTDGADKNGPLQEKYYPVSIVTTHPTEQNAILLEFESVDTFRNVQGAINIVYNQVSGTLSGAGGAVASFEVGFIPTELTEQPAGIGANEHVTATVGGSVEMLFITKLPTYESEYMSATVSGTIQVIHIDDINP